ncbi:MAG: hypothetical protein FWD15_03835 [Alphaproteobacteria bacterium]|nr:hypothetical protein [Alphaproteobacteria bacterium]
MKKFFGFVKIAIVVALAFIALRAMMWHGYRFNILNMRHIEIFFQMFADGRILGAKYGSMLLIIAGAGLMTYGFGGVIWCKDCMDWEPKKPKAEEPSEPKKEADSSNVPESLKTEAVKAEERAAAASKARAATAAEEIQPKRDDTPYAAPKKVVLENPVERPAPMPGPMTAPAPMPMPTPSPELDMDEEKNRAEMQAKIREIMEKVNANAEAAEPMPAPAAEPEHILSHANLDGKKKKKPEAAEALPTLVEPEVMPPAPMPTAPRPITKWGFSRISEAENSAMENLLIGSGAKLLSEIRIGHDGVDYLALCDSEIALVQVDASHGAWIAGNEVIDGEIRWFSEEDSKPSPVERALATKKVVEELIGAAAGLPIVPYVCTTNSTIVNADDMKAEWAAAGVKVCGIDEGQELPLISDMFKPESRNPIDEDIMQKVISIFEKAEEPE